jgi:hypothetical protein
MKLRESELGGKAEKTCSPVSFIFCKEVTMKLKFLKAKLPTILSAVACSIK